MARRAAALRREDASQQARAEIRNLDHDRNVRGASKIDQPNMFAESAGIDSEPGGCSEETHHGVSTARVGGTPCSALSFGTATFGGGSETRPSYPYWHQRLNPRLNPPPVPIRNAQ
jgi:hypothetical protein